MAAYRSTQGYSGNPKQWNPFALKQPASDNSAKPEVSSPSRHPMPVSSMQESANATYTPPSLPDYLKSVFDLKSIVGSPSDDEVQGIHAVLRMTHSTSHITGIFDLELSMNLSQHLFEVQLARHRERYPLGLFPDDVVYTPPALPSHVSVKLEPIHGVPSDENLQSVHASIRAYEHISHVPSLFDPKVEMELSQHLFNIQMARYMSRKPQRDPEYKAKPCPKKKHTPKRSGSFVPIDHRSDISDGDASNATKDADGDDLAELTQSVPQVEPTEGISVRGVTISGPDRLLEELVETMKSIKRVLVSTQQENVRRMRRDETDIEKLDWLARYAIINDKGDLPVNQGLPSVGRSVCNPYNETISDDYLAQYLRFYDIGHQFIEPGEAPTLKDGCRAAAANLLSDYLT